MLYSLDIELHYIVYCRMQKVSTTATPGGSNIILHSLQLQRYVADMRQMIAEAQSKIDITVSRTTLFTIA